MSDNWQWNGLQAKTALIYSDDFNRFSYGEDHPFKVQRYILASELIRSYGLLEAPGTLISSYRTITEAELQTFHQADYLARLMEFSESAGPRADFRFGLG